ncbi:MAG: peptidoglycan DD-metalloendopeptidase family protein [Chloroflexi bacterium]|nr:peptidoglycan DD-metalloendopeptidase family protein [Chloroflexota bacterium]
MDTPHKPFDGLFLASILLILFLGYNLLEDRSRAASPALGGVVSAAAAELPALAPSPGDPAAFAAPYSEYALTQGPHGYAYGHMAIDLSAGEGAPVFSPIHGAVAERYTDEYGNPTLILENEFYRVTLLHGDYVVSSGEAVSLGQVLGYEDNQGYTTDMQGRPCQNRDCGYHTHLNVFDKRLGENVNPLDLLP